jgi:hypothetical protein
MHQLPLLCTILDVPIGLSIDGFALGTIHEMKGSFWGSPCEVSLGIYTHVHAHTHTHTHTHTQIKRDSSQIQWLALLRQTII